MGLVGVESHTWRLVGPQIQGLNPQHERRMECKLRGRPGHQKRKFSRVRDVRVIGLFKVEELITFPKITQRNKGENGVLLVKRFIIDPTRKYLRALL